MRIALHFLLLLSGAGHALGAVVSYEPTSFPEDGQGWTRIMDCTPERWIESGWFYQNVQSGECFEPPAGDQDVYTRLIDEFEGEQAFFVEWRLEADGDSSEIPWGAPTALAAGSLGPVRYTFYIARDLAKLNRDNTLPIVFVDIEPGPHTHRLELYGPDLYIWYIDTQIVDSGKPEGPYPSNDPRITWGARSAFLESTAKWKYIRFGRIPEDGSGDYDSDGDVDGEDFYFFQDYFSGPDVDAGPGGRFADFDFDTDIDCDDWTAFLAAWTDPSDPPPFAPCLADPIPTLSQWGIIAMIVMFLSAGTAVLRRRARAPSCRGPEN